MKKAKFAISDQNKQSLLPIAPSKELINIKPTCKLAKLYFFLLGFVGLAPFAIMVTEADFFDIYFPRYLASVYIVFPTNFSTIFSLLLNKICGKLEIEQKLMITLPIFVFGICSLPLIAKISPDNLYSIFKNLKKVMLFFVL